MQLLKDDDNYDENLTARGYERHQPRHKIVVRVYTPPAACEQIHVETASTPST